MNQLAEKKRDEITSILRAPFEGSDIGKLPKPTRGQTDEVKRDYKKGVRCTICGGWHHPKVVHLDYVGHAAITNRLLDADPLWSWRPLAFTDAGFPALDADNLLWIELTINGITRLGVGDAGSKTGGDAMKERIGDALRNAAMRFGVALELWHKGEFQPAEEAPEMLPEYPQDSFDENISKWKEVIQNTSKSCEDMINTISTKYTLSEQQKKDINAIGEVNEDA